MLNELSGVTGVWGVPDTSIRSLVRVCLTLEDLEHGKRDSWVVILEGFPLDGPIMEVVVFQESRIQKGWT